MSIDEKAFDVAWRNFIPPINRKGKARDLIRDYEAAKSPEQPVGQPIIEVQAILNTLGELKEPWDRLRPYVNATPELISLLYDLDLMPEQIHVRRNFVRMMQLAEWHKHYRKPERES